MKENNRLFVPLGKAAFMDFRDAGKEIELRKYGRGFTERYVYQGRLVELRLGYSGHESIWGTIGQVVIGNLDEIFSRFDLEKIEPGFSTVQEAILDNIKLLGDLDKAIAFQILQKRLTSV